MTSGVSDPAPPERLGLVLMIHRTPRSGSERDGDELAELDDTNGCPAHLR